MFFKQGNITNHNMQGIVDTILPSPPYTYTTYKSLNHINLLHEPKQTIRHRQMQASVLQVPRDTHSQA